MVPVQTRNVEVMKSAVLITYEQNIGAVDFISSYVHYSAMARYQPNEILYETISSPEGHVYAKHL
jgi:hypothetical protein